MRLIILNGCSVPEPLRMNEILLVITEGKRPEKEIVDFLMQRLEEAASKPRIVWGYWHTDLLDLCKKVLCDPYLDYLGLLQKYTDNLELKDLDQDSVSETYLFFDLDAHCSKYVCSGLDAYLDQVQKVLSQCTNETSPLGKLYISYPMAEALWDYSIEDSSSARRCFFPLSHGALYKRHVQERNPHKGEPLSSVQWMKLCDIHFRRAFGISMHSLESYSYTALKNLTQQQIFVSQRKIVSVYSQIFALSPFPLFLLDIRGEHLFNEVSQGAGSSLCAYDCFI